MKKTLAPKFITLFFLFGCTSAIDTQGYANDPWEPINRGVFAFNETLDKIVLKPVAQSYEFVFPRPLRTGVGNFFSNLGDLGSLANAILQLDGEASAAIAARVIDNTFFGLGGLFDVATAMGNPKIPRDFGGTLAHYGVRSGPYLVLPIFGPSTLRDGIAKLPDRYLNPITYLPEESTRWQAIGLDAVQTRAAYLPLERQLEGTSTDKYATLRDAYLQRRWAQLGTPISTAQQEDIDALFAPHPPLSTGGETQPEGRDTSAAGAPSSAQALFPATLFPNKRNTAPSEAE